MHDWCILMKACRHGAAFSSAGNFTVRMPAEGVYSGKCAKVQIVQKVFSCVCKRMYYNEKNAHCFLIGEL